MWQFRLIKWNLKTKPPFLTITSAVQCSAAILIYHKTFRACWRKEVPSFACCWGPEPRGHKQPKQNHQLVTVHVPFPHISHRPSRFKGPGGHPSSQWAWRGVARHLFSAIFQLLLLDSLLKCMPPWTLGWAYNVHLAVYAAPEKRRKCNGFFRCLQKGLCLKAGNTVNNIFLFF